MGQEEGDSTDLGQEVRLWRLEGVEGSGGDGPHFVEPSIR